MTSRQEAPLGHERVAQIIRERPNTTVAYLVTHTGLAESYVRRVVIRLQQQGRIHVSGYDESYKRRKPKMYSLGPGEGGQEEPYPYVSAAQQRENLRTWYRAYYQRKKIKEATRSGGVFGSMVAQMQVGERDRDHGAE